MKITLSSRLPKDKGVLIVEVVVDRSTITLLMPSGQKILRLGVDDAKKITRRTLPALIRKVVGLAKAQRSKKLALKLSDFSFEHLDVSETELAELIAVNAEMANFEFVKYRTRPKEGWNFLDEILVIAKESPHIKGAIKKGQYIGRAVNETRTLSNTPAGEMTPRLLAEAAREAAREAGVQISILDRDEMKELGMGGVLGVAQGSSEEPRFIVMEYYGSEPAERPIVFVGKGVTFDSGGINLKPGDHSQEMKMDMSGGSAVIHAVTLAAQLKLKINVIGLVPAVENMPSGSSYRPGDVLKSLSGKTIEVLNTDAEGRIILADGLTYAEQFRPQLVVDVATLTGAAQVALGNRASALFTSDPVLEQMFKELGEVSGDQVWPLPLWAEYEEEVRGTFGDVANLGKYDRYGGAITAAVFLWQFAKKYPWVHLDIAPRMTPIEGDYLAKGATGEPVRLLIKLLERYAERNEDSSDIPRARTQNSK